MPTALAYNSHNRQSKICPDRSGRLNIKQNSQFTLSCGSSKFASDSLGDIDKINVECLGGNSLSFRGDTYEYEDLKCEGLSSNSTNSSEELDDCIYNTEQHIKDKIEEFNDDEIKARMKILKEYKGKFAVIVNKYILVHIVTVVLCLIFKDFHSVKIKINN